MNRFWGDRVNSIKLICAALLALPLTLHAATYYLDSVQGNDANPGTSISNPWRSLAKVNETNYRPGDEVLLKTGSEWQGQLAPTSSGGDGKPIIIDSYGKGPKPRIDGMGSVEDVVRLYNLDEIEVHNLEITNKGTTSAVRRGVYIFLDNYGTAKHIVVSGMYIHDVNGTNTRKDNGGIIFRTNGDKKPSRFDGLVIEKNIVWKVDRSAISAESYHAMREHWFPSLHVVIRDNYVDDIGGDGIVPWATDGAIVEHNIALNCNMRADTYDAGIWPWSTDNTTMQLNEAAFTRTTKDGEGFDSDYNSRNTLFQYNYSHDNQGGFMLICSPGERNPAGNIGNQGTIIRHNISRNDRSLIFSLSGDVQLTTVAHNAIYVGTGIDVQMLMVGDWHGWPKQAIFENNTFYVQGTARYGHQVSRNQDGSYRIGPGWGPATGIAFRGNTYMGKNVDRPHDPTGIVKAAVKLPSLNWAEPQFDPSRPENFDLFLVRHRTWITHLFEQQFGGPPDLKH